MADESLHTIALQGWLQRLRTGDAAARDELLRACSRRLESLARRMLRGYPVVARWEDTADVFQNAAVRLLRALETVPVADTREFYNLAASIIRRELIDLARHFRGPHGLGANHDSHDPAHAAAPASLDAASLDRWAALHEAAEKLPVEEREVFGLTFYHDWTQQQIADLFGIDVRTVGRRWKRAAEAIQAALGGNLPGE